MGKPGRIRGRLSILVLQNVSDSEDAGNARLKDKKDIKEYGKVSKSFEFYGTPVAPFEFLCILKFVNIPNWEFGEPSGVTEGQFPVLQEPHLKKYEELIRKLPGSLPLLVKLHIAECSKLEFLINETATYPNLEMLEIIINCDSLTHFKLKSVNKLKYLLVKDCKNLENVEVSENANWNLQFVEDLEIFDCPKLNLISEANLPTLNLKTLLISNCINLESMPNQICRILTSLEELSIFCCSKLQPFPNGGFPPILQSLLIEKCDLVTLQHASIQYGVTH
ncbi:hypothetical protein Dsin_012226 [Dipteronia sinensis]|uniref:Uncharacterized protein n=1 Tax=Dipteronia sinensis TaxID=43782 RepID=A0AAE0E7T8_9ROSI|nr:hypothetical protein Dsin_012226 [Dipteronia sinensis]